MASPADKTETPYREVGNPPPSGGREVKYILILAVDAERHMVRVVPVSNDPRAETDDSLVVEDTPLEEPLVVWPTIVVDIPARLLYKPLKGFSPEVTDAVAADAPCDGVRRGEDHAENDSPFVDNRVDHAAILLRWCLEE